jgi:hypothetical protein
MADLKETDIAPPGAGDFSKAWEALAKIKGASYVAQKYSIVIRTNGSRTGLFPDKSVRGYTWHHVEDKTTMQLIDKIIHVTFTHSGGASSSRNEAGEYKC